VDAWGTVDAGDEQHQDDRPQRSRRETDDSLIRFQFATHRRNARRRIPLSADPAVRVLTLDADPPPPAAEPRAEGSSPGLRRVRDVVPIAVEVRLRRNAPPSADQVDDMLSWLRTHRVAAQATPRPLPVPPPLPTLEPPPPEPAPPAPAPGPALVAPPASGALWPVVAVVLGLGAALAAAIVL